MIVYNDPRRFGFFKLLNNNKELKKYFQNLVQKQFLKKFNFKYIKNKFKKKKKY